MRDIVSQQLKLVSVHQMLNVTTGAGEKVVNAQNLIAAVKKTLAKMRAEKARSTSNHYALASCAHVGQFLKNQD
jgi:hypothetical protein